MPNSVRCRLLVFALVVLILAFPTIAGAQKDAGSIVGWVKDSSGALVGQATVTVTDVERGSNFSTKTSDDGEYVAGPLRVGRYTAPSSIPGSKRRFPKW